MTPEEMRELIRTTMQETKLWNSLIIAVVPVILTMITTVVTNIIYDAFKRKKDFVKNYKIEELKELYLPLYCMIAQSEYIRKTVGSLPGIDLSIDNAPYIHLEKKTTETNIKNNQVKIVTYEKNDQLTQYDENYMVNLVIDNSKYATTKLIKLAIAYRFLIDNRDTNDANIKKVLDSEYNPVVKEFINNIICETNNKLKYCNMDYNKNELNHDKNKFSFDFKVY